MARYIMQQRLLSFGDDFDIADEYGNLAYKVDGKAFRLRDTFVIEDPQGREVATIREKRLSLRESMDISRGGDRIATVRKARFAPLRDRFPIEVAGGQEMVAQGNILFHEYEIRRGGAAVAVIAKHPFAMNDTYFIDIAPGEDEGLVLAVAVAIDEIAHDDPHGGR